MWLASSSEVTFHASAAAASFLISKGAGRVSRLSIKALTKDGPEMIFLICAPERFHSNIHTQTSETKKNMQLILTL